MNGDTQRLIAVALVLAVVCGLALAGGMALLLARLGRRKIARWERGAAWTALGLLALGLACFAYGALVEADWIEVTRHEVRTPKLRVGQRLRIVQVSDFHVDRWTRALRALPGLVNAEHPDLVVFTGDAMNELPAKPIVHEVLRKMTAPLGRYVAWGEHDVWRWFQIDLFPDEVAAELTGVDPIPLLGGAAGLCGGIFGATGNLGKCVSNASPGFSILAYHTPDLVETLKPAPDLYLAGHTHGGQVRLPFFGAVMTLSRHDKKYEAGRYQVGTTTLYVNRGIGQGPSVPRVRFLCRPEVAVIDVVGIAAAPE